MTISKKLSVALLSCALFTGCSSILPKGAEAPREYTLNAPMTGNPVGTPLPVSLQIILPQATPGLESDRIILRRDDNRVDYFANVKWTSGLSTVMQSLLVESFDRSHALRSVGNDLVAMNKDYTLLVEIRDFQAEYITNNPTPRAHIRLTAKLLKADTNIVVATRNYEEKEIATNDDMASIIRAFDNAQQHALEKLVSDMLDVLKTAAPVKNKAAK